MPELKEVRKALKNLSASTDPEKLKGLDAIVLFDIEGEKGGIWTVEIDDGQISVAEGETKSPDVTIGAAADDLIDLIKGRLNPMAAFMQGRLKVKGDMSKAMQMQKLFG